MSSKINIWSIVGGHFAAFKKADGTVAYADWFTFVSVPIVFGIVSVYSGFNLSENLRSLLVNFGAILTALLLSVLVLVYDQESKLRELSSANALQKKKMLLLHELYYSISFSMLCSIFVVVLCFGHAVISDVCLPISLFGLTLELKPSIQFLTPLAVVVTCALLLNIVMIIKRMHVLLTVAK